MTQHDTEARQAGVRRTVWRSVAALVGMFAFAFALVPLYDVFCRVTGINGKVDTTAQALVHDEVDESRLVTVQFITRNGSGLPWRLDVETRQVRLHPGQTSEVNFTFSNQSSGESWGRAVPSVSPSTATRHVRKSSCFCFEEQQLQAGERVELPLVFQLARDLPPEVNTVTLVYTLYPVEGKTQSLQAGVKRDEGGEA
ncbi:cytochrome c oxidase assembly protein [Halomonas daqingensis]|uniref:Cytochrome c oxidase assembly protein CtaG n=1 Tax=Billgrantia desiderata TaxID=52021 RepID=A0AAW4YS42_9GAMM|nr:cytochrome c oxidase assembly protein [Halomonas desiderata]MCE8040796.1 cytochrome c oxidase assembly protein [Halomonas desiderata]MCE8045371.1 cytochrome c oxidase assembly protein [Halomonas desiderata]MCE8050771.1 cytochrome c oxidase assembly protein [Halomonas desiderata]SEF47064.1 cytochrome c oxidase assembly protein subunit 11 [Halomonas desiderata]